METKTEIQAQLGLYARQTDVFNPANQEHQKPIVIVGAGTIGSWLTFGLSKLGFNNITVIDDDTVELHNCSNQLFIPSQVGKPKVDALCSILRGFSLTPPQTINSRLDSSSVNIFPNTILVSAVDNMATRIYMLEKMVLNPNIAHFVDGRMGGQVIRVYGIKNTTEDIKFYTDNCYTDDTSNIENKN